VVWMSELIRCLSNPALVVPRVVSLVTLFPEGFSVNFPYWNGLGRAFVLHPLWFCVLAANSCCEMILGPGRVWAAPCTGHRGLLPVPPGNPTTLSSGMKYLQCKEFHRCFR